MATWHEKDQALIPKDDGEEYLTTVEAAKRIRCHPGTLNHWRAQGIGPKFHKFGRIVRYRVSELDDWAYYDDHREERW